MNALLLTKPPHTARIQKNSTQIDLNTLLTGESLERGSKLSRTDGMRRPVSGRDAVRSQVIDVLKCTDKKETGNEEG
jgi:hypothetical protein